MIKTIITKEVYETFDGQQFDTEREAITHEKEVINANISTEQLSILLKERINATPCEACPFRLNVNGDCSFNMCFCDMF